MKTEEGIVFEIDGKNAKVRAGRHSECEKCGACPGNGASVITVLNCVNAHVGQRVRFEIQEDATLKGAFLIFAFPLIALFTGVWLGGMALTSLSGNVLIGRIIGGIVFFALSALLIRYSDKKKGFSGALPSIVEIIG